MQNLLLFRYEFGALAEHVALLQWMDLIGSVMASHLYVWPLLQTLVWCYGSVAVFFTAIYQLIPVIYCTK